MAYQGSSDYRRGRNRGEEWRGEAEREGERPQSYERDYERGRQGPEQQRFGSSYEEGGRGQRFDTGYEERQRGGEFRGGSEESGRGPEWRGSRTSGFQQGRYGPQGYGSPGYGRESSQRFQGYGSQGPAYGSPRYGAPRQSQYGERSFEESRGSSFAGGGSPEMAGTWEGYGSRRYGQGFSGESGGYGTYGPAARYGAGAQGFGETSGYREQEFGTPGRIRGRYTGRGPKGYARSDDRIREDVSDRLEQHGEIDAGDIVVVVEAAEVTLEGTVPDRLTKRLAEDVAEDSPGVKQVHNRLRVQGNGGQSERETGRQLTSRQPGQTTGGQTGRSMTGQSGQSGTPGGSLPSGSTEGTERPKGGSTTKSSTRT